MNIYVEHSKLLALKAKIKGLAEEGRRTRKFIHNSSHQKRYRHWVVKRAIGQEARYHLLAYGLLRGVPYEVIEPNSEPWGVRYLDYSYLAMIIQRHCHYYDCPMWNPANIERLVRTGTMAVTATVLQKVTS